MNSALGNTIIRQDEHFSPESLGNHSFFQLIELLAKKHSFNLETLDENTLSESLFCFKTNAGLGFPVSEISSIQVDDNNNLSLPLYTIEVNFLGMHGASSPLPGFLLEEIAHEHAQSNGIKHQFLDFFNHRLNVYLYKIWRKYRYYSCFKADAEDAFSSKIFSLAGLNDISLRENNGAATSHIQAQNNEPTINWGKLLSFSGLIVSRSRSPSIVSGIIAYYFNLKKVELKEWQIRLVDIPQHQKNSLGSMNSCLGDDFVVGDKVKTRSSKFIISIGGLTKKRFNDFLPSGKAYSELKVLIAFLIRDQMVYDLHLGLIQEEIPPFQMNKNNQLFLGWNTFTGGNDLLTESVVNIRGSE